MHPAVLTRCRSRRPLPRALLLPPPHLIKDDRRDPCRKLVADAASCSLHTRSAALPNAAASTAPPAGSTLTPS